MSLYIDNAVKYEHALVSSFLKQDEMLHEYVRFLQIYF